MKIRLISLAAAILLLSGCSASRISFNMLAPAPVYVPSEVKSVALINRTMPSNNDLNKLEGILTGEGKDQDRQTSTYVLEGLSQNLNNSSRYQYISTGEIMIGSGIGNLLPAPLPWDLVSELCNKYEVDAIVSLEAYDSDFIVSGGVAPVNNRLGLATQSSTRVNCGFRMYYPSDMRIVDEFIFSHSVTSDNSSLPILQTVNAIARKNEEIRQASMAAGMVYGQRITPSWILASRDYFRKSKSSPDLEEGARMMELNDWDNAIASLNRAVESGKTKDRGRAAHNLAVVYEILGDLQQAREWTTVAWGRYKEKASREYGYLLGQRIRDQELLQQQMEK